MISVYQVTDFEHFGVIPTFRHEPCEPNKPYEGEFTELVQEQYQLYRSLVRYLARYGPAIALQRRVRLRDLGISERFSDGVPSSVRLMLLFQSSERLSGRFVNGNTCRSNMKTLQPANLAISISTLASHQA
jgi:hypothetical protein